MIKVLLDKLWIDTVGWVIWPVKIVPDMYWWDVKPYSTTTSWVMYCKTCIFVCPLFCKFRDVGNYTKIFEISCYFSVLRSSASKNAKINGAKVIW